MKFKNFNKKKLLIVLLSGFVVTSLVGCKNNQGENINYDITQKETSTNEKPTETETTFKQYSENDIVAINTFEKLEIEINEIKEDDKVFLDKAKGVFITTIDFIFYDSEINGVKFDDLTDSGKQEILKIASNIDLKIENKFPNYKNEISEIASNALNKASELIEKGSNNINEFAKEKLGDENYNTLIEVKDELVDYTKNAFDIIGDFSSNLYDSGKEKVKNWYEEFKNK